MRELEILGFLVNEQGIRPQEQKVEAIRNMVPPSDFAYHASYLSDLTRKHSRWNWTTDHQHAFDYLLTVLTTEVIQHHPDLNKAFELYTDASAIAVGAILVQWDEYGNPRPVQFISGVYIMTSPPPTEAMDVSTARKRRHPDPHMPYAARGTTSLWCSITTADTTRDRHDFPYPAVLLLCSLQIFVNSKALHPLPNGVLAQEDARAWRLTHE